MGENVLIKIKTTQIDHKGEKEDIELFTQGKFYKKNNALYYMYEETELSGMKGTTTTLKIVEQTVSLKRYGKNNSELIFEKGRRFKSIYKTGNGDINMEILTKDVDIKINEANNNVDIHINYDINIAGLFDGKNIVNIKIN